LSPADTCPSPADTCSSPADTQGTSEYQTATNDSFSHSCQISNKNYYTEIVLNCSILLNCEHLILRSAFLCSTSINILPSFSLYCLYMFRPNRPPSGVQLVVMKESAA
jgi:hypothetical protein